MRFRHIKYYLFFALVLSAEPLVAQTDIGSDTINVYTAIVEAFGVNTLNNDTLKVSDVSGFSAGDTVMIYQVKGAEVDNKLPVPNDGSIGNYRPNVGKYAIMKIDSIHDADSLIFLNSTLPFKFAYHNGEMGQLIKVRSFRRARITSTLTAPDWDPETGTGGVVVLYVQRSLEFAANIDVSGKGFTGASMGTEEYTGSCSSADITGYSKYFYTESATDSSAHIGEGIADTTFVFTRGRGRQINGGGGGNGRYSGGGGGGNYYSGGLGGNESTNECGAGAVTNGLGGSGLSSFYTNDTSNSSFYTNRIFFGGGGGTGTQNPGSGRTASKGGDGGGIVVIVADSIIGNGHTINANGSSVTTSATAGAGGGGGGGVIVMDVSTVTGLSISAHGGNGGNTSYATDPTGPGGGGGGGMYWISGASKPGLTMDLITFGLAGRFGGNTYGAGDGNPAGLLWNLKLPLRGFLFNTIPEGTTVCSDVIPNPIVGSEPKGGDGPGTYIYSWISKTNSGSWTTVSGATSRDLSFTAPLTDTTSFRRIVESGPSLVDTSSVYILNVHPKINGNLIGDPDTVCYGGIPLGLSPKDVLSGGPYSGVPSSYTYQWRQSNDASVWSNASGTSTQEAYAPAGLNDTTYYRRIVFAGVCDDTSNIVEITVLPQLLGNTIAADQVICYNDTPDPIDGPVPTGGLPADIRYQWQAASSEAGTYSDIGTAKSYSPGALTDSLYFRRIVFSGLQDECIDTSNTVPVIVLSLIGNNTISEDDSVCAGTNVTGLTGLDPTGGDNNYSYVWQSSSDQVTWDSITQFITNLSFDPGILYDTTWYRRMVKSGLNDVCRDISNVIEISVLPAIDNNLIPTSEVLLCEGSDFPLLDATYPTGGNKAYTFMWEESTGDSLNWTTPGFGATDNEDYSPGQRLATTYFRRIVWSGQNGICRDTTFAWEGLVQDSIRNNEINSYQVDNCYNTVPDLLDGTSSSQLTGGDETSYTFKWEERTAFSAYSVPSQSSAGEDYQPEALTEDRFYRRIVISGVCADTTSEVELIIRTLPRADLQSITDTLCEGEAFNLEISLTGSPSWTIRYNDGITGDSELSGISTSPASIAVNPETDDSLTYVYQLVSITDGYGCIAPADSMTGSVSLRVYQTPVAEILDTDVEVCDTTVILTTNPDNGTGTWSVVSGPGTLYFDDLHAEEGVLRIDDAAAEYGVYTVQWLRAAPKCPGTPDQTTVTFFEKPEPANAGDDIYIYMDDKTLLHADPVTAGSGLWSVVAGPGVVSDLSNPYSQVTDLVMTDVANGDINMFSWTVSNGVCAETSDTVTVFSYPEKHYTGFSPNGDGVNDYFVIWGLRDASDFDFLVFNNTGALIRRIKMSDMDPTDLITQGEVVDELKLWDGTGGNGAVVPDGTYYYVIRIWSGDEVIEEIRDFVIVKTR